jgi:Na+/proline symporter/signal transduction histidine kinase
MLATPVIVIASFAYLGLLFAIAHQAERRAAIGRSLIRNPYVYTLSIAVYCTSWTFYGAVGSAARDGFEFVTIYIGPTVVFLGWWFLLRKMVRISKTHRITSIADFISSRYGKSTALGATVTLIALVGTTPYISLQLKAVATSFTVLVGYHGIDGPFVAPTPTVIADTAFWIAAGMAAFVILFGTRNLDADEHHEGVVAAIAFESFVKLFALVAVGSFVIFALSGGVGQFLADISDKPQIGRLFTLSQSQGPRWLTLTLLSMAAVICLPRQFQMVVVENVDERHLATAAWLFPLYLWLMSLFALPIAVAGLSLLPDQADADFYVLTVPMTQGQGVLALAAFIGGLSSATSMVIVAAIALSTMICNDLVMPLLLRLRWLRLSTRRDLTGALLAVRRISICLVMLMGFAYYRAAGESGALASIGLTSFAAVAQFVPVIVGGLFWKGGARAGAVSGLLGGVAVWAYTLVLPSIAEAGWPGPTLLRDGPWGVAMLRPQALFGLNDLDALTHAMFWSMLVNVALYVLVSLFSRQDVLERIQGALFVDVFRQRAGESPHLWRHSATVDDLYALVQRFLGRERTYRAFRDYARDRGMRGTMPASADAELIGFAERLLAGSIGAASARVMVGTVTKGEMPRLDEVMRILEETHQAIEYSQRLEQSSRELRATAAELQAANKRLQDLDRLKDEFLSTVSHELRTPLTSIRAFSEILSDHADLDRGERDRFLDIIVSESRRLTRLLDEILDLARLEAGRSEWRLTPVGAGGALRDAVAAAGGLFAERQLRLDVAIDPHDVVLKADRDRLMQLFMNLLSNATKFCAAENGAVRVSGRPQAGGYLVTVTDNGPGVAPGDAERIFEKFVKISPERTDRRQGSGLGLAICRQIVEHHGGRIWLDPRAEGGASFCVFLPAPSVQDEALPEQGAIQALAARAS